MSNPFYLIKVIWQKNWKHLFGLLFCLLLLSSCNHTQTANENLNAEQLFKQAGQHKQEKRFSKSLSLLETLAKLYPYDTLNQKAFLLRADIHFAEEEYKKASLKYETFQKLYPYTNLDYTHYQLGLSYFFQIPAKPDKDLSQADKALEHFNFLAKKKGTYQKKSKEYVSKIQEIKGKKDFQAAAFYMKKNWNSSAYKKFKKFLIQYPNHSFVPQALLYSYRLAKKTNQKSKKFKSRLLKDFPNSKESKLL